MAALYPKTARDSVLIIAFNQEIYDLGEANKLLKEHGFEEFYKGREI